jgi:TetR/AcrR family transcriptional regulator, transcriptional repressor of aconitase
VVARRRFEQLSPERQDEILKLAAHEFARSGYQGTSYNQLLDRLHLGKSSAYYYFEGKRDLFLTVIERCYAVYFESLAKLERPKSASQFWEFVHRATVLAFEFMLQDPITGQLVQCMHRERALLGELASEEVLASMAGYYDDLVRDGRRLGAIRKDLSKELLGDLLRNVSATFDQWFIAEHPTRRPRQVEQAATLFTDLARRLAEPRRL